jgi:aspartokinase
MSRLPSIHAFGSDVLAAAQGWRAAAEAVAASRPAPVAAVLSQPGAAREGLACALHAAGAGAEGRAKVEFQGVVEGLEALAGELGVLDCFQEEAQPLLRRLAELVQGASLVGHVSPRTRNGAFGVLGNLTVSLFSALLARDGVEARMEGRGLDAAPNPGCVLPSGPLPAAPEPGEVLVLPGGVGTGPGGTPLSFGPGGQDLSAVALASEWGLQDLRIWTLDDGLQTADPFLVPGARALPMLSYAEALALSGFGGRILQADVLVQAEAAGLVLHVGNLLRPAVSTRISRTAPWREPGTVASVAYKEGLHLLRLPPTEDLEALAATDRALREAGVRRLGAILGPEGTLLVLLAESEAAVGALAARAEQGGELQSGWALVALVGEGLRAAPGGALRLLAPVGLEDLGGLLAGSSPISLSFLVPEARLADLVPRLHRAHVEALVRPLALAPLSL